MRALIADDSPTIRKILTQALRLAGFADIAEAADGAEAVVRATGGNFDLILMDWNMPRLCGIDALRALRQAGTKTPVIMVTTEAEKARVLEAIQSGANDYLIKPFSPDQLVTKVRNLLGAGTGTR